MTGGLRDLATQRLGYLDETVEQLKAAEIVPDPHPRRAAVTAGSLEQSPAPFDPLPLPPREAGQADPASFGTDELPTALEVRHTLQRGPRLRIMINELMGLFRSSRKRAVAVSPSRRDLG